MYHLIKCPLCDKVLENQNELTRHIREHNDDSKICCICGKELSSTNSLDRHMLIHSGERPYQCKICNVKFKTSGNCSRHMKSHQNQDNVVGSSSDNIEVKQISSPRKKRVKKLANLAENQSSNNAMSNLPVDNFLGNSLINSSSIDFLAILSDFISSQQQLKQSFTDSSSSQNNNILAALLNPIDQESENFTSKGLKRSLQDAFDEDSLSNNAHSKNLVDSLNVSSNSTSSTSQQDDLSSTNDTIDSSVNLVLIDPMIENSYELFEKPNLDVNFGCSICELIVKSAATLRRHQKIHKANGMVYKCENCTYRSVDKSSLNRHARKHNGERPFECSICKFMFTTKANCERHTKVHPEAVNKRSDEIVIVHKSNNTLPLIIHPSYEPTSDETYCRLCNRDFKVARSLRLHLKQMAKLSENGNQEMNPITRSVSMFELNNNQIENNQYSNVVTDEHQLSMSQSLNSNSFLALNQALDLSMKKENQATNEQTFEPNLDSALLMMKLNLLLSNFKDNQL